MFRTANFSRFWTFQVKMGMYRNLTQISGKKAHFFEKLNSIWLDLGDNFIYYDMAYLKSMALRKNVSYGQKFTPSAFIALKIQKIYLVVY